VKNHNLYLLYKKGQMFALYEENVSTIKDMQQGKALIIQGQAMKVNVISSLRTVLLLFLLIFFIVCNRNKLQGQQNR
jgi:hypothetical protein